MEFTVQQIAEVLGGTVEGDATQRISSLAKIEEAQAGSLTFLSNAKYEPFLYETGASAVIVGREQALRQAVRPALIRVENPYTAFSQLLEFYAQATRTGKRGVEQPSYIAESSVIGAGALPRRLFLHRRTVQAGRKTSSMFPARLHRRPGDASAKAASSTPALKFTRTP